MNYRKYGRQEFSVSEIGLGGHREGVETRDGVARTARFFTSAQERAKVVGRAIDAGVTYFETTYGCEIASLGESLRLLETHDGLFVSGMRVDFFSNLLRGDLDVRAYTRREVEGRIRDFGFDHIDQFIMGAMEGGDPLSHPASILEEAFEELEKLKEEGKVRFVGFSCHEPDYAAKLLLRHPQFDAVMVPYSFMNRQAERALADAVKQTGAAWIAMKTLVWHVYGIPVTVLRNLPAVSGRLSHDPSAQISTLAHQYVLQNPLITTCVPAANSVAQFDENIQASGRGALTEDDTAALSAFESAMSAEQSIPLALAGLKETNGRILAHAIGLLNWRLKLGLPDIDWEADDAETRARDLARELLAQFASQREYVDLLQ